jgi:hypothetical protein
MNGDERASAAPVAAGPARAAPSGRSGRTTGQRPIGWWLKEADAALDGAFEAAVGSAGTSRRDWQVLTTLAAGPATRAELAAMLTRFDPAAVVGDVVDDLIARGWVAEPGQTDPATADPATADPATAGSAPAGSARSGALTLTDAGRAAEAELAGRVGQVRRQVADALPDGDYDRLVHLLDRLVTAIR